MYYSRLFLSTNTKWFYTVVFLLKPLIGLVKFYEIAVLLNGLLDLQIPEPMTSWMQALAFSL